MKLAGEVQSPVTLATQAVQATTRKIPRLEVNNNVLCVYISTCIKINTNNYSVYDAGN